jgi:ATP-dependent DNA helicase RecQ
MMRALLPNAEVSSACQAESTVLPVLDEWRAGVARQMGVPPYVVISDAVLRGISEAQPQTRIDLARIRGVGPRLLAKFADDLLGFFRPRADQACP